MKNKTIETQAIVDKEGNIVYVFTGDDIKRYKPSDIRKGEAIKKVKIIIED